MPLRSPAPKHFKWWSRTSFVEAISRSSFIGFGARFIYLRSLSRVVRGDRRRTGRGRKGVSAGSSFNNPIRPQQQRLGDRQAESLRRLEVDDEIKLRRLLDGEIGGIRSFENFIDVSRGAAEQVSKARAVCEKTSGFRPLCREIYRRQAVLYCKVDNFFSLGS